MRQIRGKPLSRRAKKPGGGGGRGQRSRLSALLPGAALARDPYEAAYLWRAVQTGFGRLPRRWGLYACAGAYALAGGFALGFSGGFDTVASASASGLRMVARAVTPDITELAMTGVPESRQVDVLMAVGASPGDPALLFDTGAARAAVEKLPWVAGAQVRRVLSGTIEIAVTARQPYAIWQRDGALSVIDRDGVVIETAHGTDFARLPLVVGKGANEAAHDFLAALERAPTLKSRVRAAVRVADRRWNLRLYNGIDIRLPEDGAGEAIAALAALDAEHGLFNRDIVAIDMRLADRITLRLSEEAAARRFGEEADKTRAGVTPPRRSGRDT